MFTKYNVEIHCGVGDGFVISTFASNFWGWDLNPAYALFVEFHVLLVLKAIPPHTPFSSPSPETCVVG